MEAASIPTPTAPPRFTLPRELIVILVASAAIVYLYRRYLDESLRQQERFNAQIAAAYQAGLQTAPAPQQGPVRRVARVVPITTANGHSRRFEAPPAQPAPQPAEEAFRPVPDAEPVETGGEVEDFETEEPELDQPDFDELRPVNPHTPGPVGDGGDAA